MVNVNIFDNETGSFWRGPGMDPTQIKTEVFFLPAAVSFEKEGSITNSGRWMQWRYQGPKPLGKSRADGEIIMELGNKIKDQYKEDGVFPEPIRNLKWDYLSKGKYDSHAVAKEINGYIYGEIENGGTHTIYVSPVPFEKLDAAIEKGKGKPHLAAVSDRMADANNLAAAMVIAPLAGIAAAARKIYNYAQKSNKSKERA